MSKPTTKKPATTKIRKCPHCKSAKGYTYDYTISGHGSETRNFKGHVIEAHRSMRDNVDYYSVKCINCDKYIDTDRLEVG